MSTPTRDELLKMASEAGLGTISKHYGWVTYNTVLASNIEKFAALLSAYQAQPRVAIENAALDRAARLCESRAGIRGTGAWTALIAAADAIRALKQAEPQQSAEPASKPADHQLWTAAVLIRELDWHEVPYPDLLKSIRDILSPITRLDTSSKAEAGEEHFIGRVFADQLTGRRWAVLNHAAAALPDMTRIDAAPVPAQPAPSEAAQEPRPTWETDGGRKCLNCGKSLIDHEGQRFCPAAQPAPARDDAIPLPHTTYNGYADGSEPLYTAEQMRDYANAVAECALQGQPAAQVTDQAKDAELLDAIAENYWQLDPVQLPTPEGDDADVGWRIVQYHMDKPYEREVAFVSNDDPRAAIRAAIAASKEASK